MRRSVLAVFMRKPSGEDLGIYRVTANVAIVTELYYLYLVIAYSLLDHLARSHHS